MSANWEPTHHLDVILWGGPEDGRVHPALPDVGDEIFARNSIEESILYKRTEKVDSFGNTIYAHANVNVDMIVDAIDNLEGGNE